MGGTFKSLINMFFLSILLFKLIQTFASNFAEHEIYLKWKKNLFDVFLWTI